jgi:hypothetical protein
MKYHFLVRCSAWLALLVSAGWLSALQDNFHGAGQDSSAPPSRSSGASNQDSKADSDKDKSDKDAAAKGKKKKQKKNRQDDPDDPMNASVFSDAIASNVISQFVEGLNGHSRRSLLSAVDDSKMDGYLQFEEQLEAFFDRYESLDVHTRIAQSSQEGGKGIVLVDVEMEEARRGGAAPPVLKREQIRFELERGRKGWKIVDLQPRSFFSYIND